MIILFVKAYLQKIIRIIRGNVCHAYMYLSGYFSVIWKAINFIDKKFPYFILSHYLERESCNNMVIHYCMDSQSYSIT